MSGEGGRWASNGSGNNSEATATDKASQPSVGWRIGNDAYNDGQGAEKIVGCHRTQWAPMFVGAGFESMNLACSGAITKSQLLDGLAKPGIDFNDPGPDSNLRGQAVLLREFAQTHDVGAVTMSIGGNDMGFSDIIQACATAYITPEPVSTLCSKQADVQKRISAPAKTELISKVSGAIQNVFDAMSQAGYAPSDWRLIYQLPPQVLPAAKNVRIPEGLYWRQDRCGLPLMDADIDWASTRVQPFLKDAIRRAVQQKSATGVPVTVLDTDALFAGHELCANGAAQTKVGGIGAPPWKPTGVDTEWVRRINVGEQKLTKLPIQLTEPMHPMYWGQRALAQCTLAAINSPRGTTAQVCTVDGDKQTDGGDPKVLAKPSTSPYLTTAVGYLMRGTVGDGIPNEAFTWTDGGLERGYSRRLDVAGPPVAVSQTSTSLYVVTNKPYRLYRCDLTGTSCKQLDTFQDKPTSVSFSGDSNGFVTVDRGMLYRYVGDSFKGKSHQFSDRPIAVSYAQDNVYVVTAGKELKRCDKDGGGCATVEKYRDTPTGVAFQLGGSGFVTVYSGAHGSNGGYLYRYRNDTEKRAWTFADWPTSVTIADDAVWVATTNNGNEIKRCDRDGEQCTTVGSVGQIASDGHLTMATSAGQ